MARPIEINLVRLKNAIDDVDDAIRLVDIGDSDVRFAAFFVLDDEIVAVHRGGERITLNRLQGSASAAHFHHLLDLCGA